MTGTAFVCRFPSFVAELRGNNRTYNVNVLLILNPARKITVSQYSVFVSTRYLTNINEECILPKLLNLLSKQFNDNTVRKFSVRLRSSAVALLVTKSTIVLNKSGCVSSRRGRPTEGRILRKFLCSL